MWQAEEGSAFLGIVAELITQDAESAFGVTEAAGDFGGRLLIDEVSAEGFVLALQGELRGKEEILVGRSGYLIRSAELHIQIVLQEHEAVNMFGGQRCLLSMKCKQQRHELHIVASKEQERNLAGLIGSHSDNLFISTAYH